MKDRNQTGTIEREFLINYKPDRYERPSVTVDMLIFTVDDAKLGKSKGTFGKELKILLIKRKKPPFMEDMALPGGFVNIEESIQDAAYRELKEETNIENVYMEQLYTWGEVNRDPRMRVISVSYMALVPKEGLRPIAGDDASEAIWFVVKKRDLMECSTNKSSMLSVESEDGCIKMGYIVTEYYERKGFVNTFRTEVEPISGNETNLAFDHIHMINMALERLKNKVEYTQIAFNLLHEEFTLPELQQVYETILGRTLYKANFRKKILPMVIKTDNKKTNVAHRPVQYYKFNPEYYAGEIDYKEE